MLLEKIRREQEALFNMKRDQPPHVIDAGSGGAKRSVSFARSIGCNRCGRLNCDGDECDRQQI